MIDHCPNLQHILMLDSNAMGALEGMGVTVSDEELESRITSVKADDLAHHRIHLRFHGGSEGRRTFAP